MITNIHGTEYGYKNYKCRCTDCKKANADSIIRRRNRNRNLVYNLKSELKCIICGEDDPVCLDFHHKEPHQKRASVGVLMQHHSIKVIKDEIDKCDVLCANCHRKHHHTKRQLVLKGGLHVE